MEQACGWCGWSPETFWGSTLDEYDAAVVGFVEIERLRAGAKNPGGPDALTDDDYEELYWMAVEARDKEKEAGV